MVVFQYLYVSNMKALPVELVGHRDLSGDRDQLFESSRGGFAVRLLACTVQLHLLFFTTMEQVKLRLLWLPNTGIVTPLTSDKSGALRNKIQTGTLHPIKIYPGWQSSQS